MQGTADCSPQGCQAALSLKFDLGSVGNYDRPVICFLYDQTEYNCKNYWQETNLGCPYNYCNMHELAPLCENGYCTPKDRPFTRNLTSGKYILHIKDPWDPWWAQGVKGGLYASSVSSYPTTTIQVKRVYVQQVHLPKGVQALQNLQNLTSAIKSHEQKLQKQLSPLNNEDPLPPNNEDPFSWLTLIRHGLNLTQAVGLKNLSHCFLCTALGKPPLVVVPLPAAFNITTNPTSSSQATSLPQVSLYHDPESQTLPFYYSTPNPSWCNHTQAPSGTQMAPVGGYFWCDQTLSKTLNHTSITQSLCVPVSLVPTLTLYGEGELSELASQLTTSSNKIQKRAIFLPLVIGVSLASSLVASGLGTGALTHSIQSTQTLSTQVQAAIEASAESLASLQRQITSVAQVAAQNRGALDLLTAEKGGACLSLGKECCYYINGLGLVDTNVQTLNKIKKELQQFNAPLNCWYHCCL
uniref:Uncharacterized protein n=1 Tax=Papio anubis TaxID=9555 RepID=A0A8I5R6X4_PAPAN